MWSKNPASNLGISISHQRVEGVVFSAAAQSVKASFGYDLPSAIFAGGRLSDEAFLKQTLENLKKNLGLAGPCKAYVSVAADMFRLMEMHKLEPKQMQLGLSSEAERFKAFDETEAVVGFHPVDIPAEGKKQSLMTVGVRKDTLNSLTRVLRQAGITPLGLSVLPVDNLRGFIGSGMLAGLVQQAGADVCWGALMCETDHVRLVVCQGTAVVALREIQINLRQAAQESLFLIEDMVDEIQRTIRQYTPRVWLADGVPEPILNLLQDRLMVPIKPLVLPKAVLGDNDPVSVGTFGASVANLVSFPFDLNLLRGVKSAGTPASAVNTSNLFQHPSTKVAAVLGGLMLLTWVTFGVLGFMDGQRIAALDQQKTTIAGQIAVKQSTLEQLKQKISVQLALLDAVQRVRSQNTVFQKLARDLRLKTPGSVWVHRIAVGPQLEIEGKALKHQAVINLARNFDTVSYLQNLDFESLKEAMVGKKAIYEFTLSAQVKSGADLLQEHQMQENKS
jgi:Tfp pilus assembly protein PilN